MRTFVITVLAASFVAAFALDRGPTLPKTAQPDPPLAAPTMPPPPALLPAGTVAIDRSPDGHFRANGTINGTATNFLVDTGASTVAFGREEARRMGVFVSDADFTATNATAAGSVKVAPVILRRMTVGSIAATDIPAAVVDVPTLTPLLGQSFLSKLSAVSIRGERMELR